MVNILTLEMDRWEMTFEVLRLPRKLVARHNQAADASIIECGKQFSRTQISSILAHEKTSHRGGREVFGDAGEASSGQEGR
jgi:hypothetical protein